MPFFTSSPFAVLDRQLELGGEDEPYLAEQLHLLVINWNILPRDHRVHLFTLDVYLF